MRLPQAVIDYIALTTPRILENWRSVDPGCCLYFNFGFVNDGGNIAPVLNPPSEKVEAFRMVLTVIADAFDISIEDLKGPSRRREISWARQIGMYLMRQHTALSLPRIGEEFGGKDHTTVLTAAINCSVAEKRFNFGTNCVS